LEEHPDRSSASKREAAIKQLPKSEKELLVRMNTIPLDLTLNNPTADFQSEATNLEHIT
jgi:predicted GIY-YIG superfamily endonuclease